MPLARPEDLVLLISPDRKRFVVRLAPGDQLHTHRGMVSYDDCIGRPLGHHVASHTGARFTMLRPTMEEILRSLPRATQIVYPKDIGYILLKLSIFPGVNVIEAGCGSGVLTAALARYVTPGGHVYSYDVRADMVARARANVERIGLGSAVTFHQQSIEAGFAETDVDALFLDLREPWFYLRQAFAALCDGGFFGAIVPTVNQVTALVKGLARAPFGEIEVSELMLRQYRALPERVRPLDRLTAHTGYLLFARKTRRAAVWSAGAPDEGCEGREGAGEDEDWAADESGAARYDEEVDAPDDPAWDDTFDPSDAEERTRDGGSRAARDPGDLLGDVAADDPGDPLVDAAERSGRGPGGARGDVAADDPDAAVPFDPNALI